MDRYVPGEPEAERGASGRGCPDVGVPAASLERLNGEHVKSGGRGGFAAGVALCAVLAACAQGQSPSVAEFPPPSGGPRPVDPESAPRGAAGGEPRPTAGEPGVVNDAWRILRMATAHDVITLEVEVADLTLAPRVARELLAPLESRYAEALVYVYAAGEGAGGHVPAMRFQWTAAGGLVAMRYPR